MKYLVYFSLFMAVGCSKHVATCLSFEEKGHGNITISAGPWGEVADVNMVGPSKFERIPEDMAFNPCQGPGISQTHP